MPQFELEKKNIGQLNLLRVLLPLMKVMMFKAQMFKRIIFICSTIMCTNNTWSFKLNDWINRKKFGVVLARRSKLDPIIRVR